MKSFLRTGALVVLVLLGMVGCVADEETVGTGPDESAEVGDPAAPGDGEVPQLVEVPDELSFDSLPDGAMNGNSFTTQACRVKLVFCQDPRFSPRHPSFCQNGCSISNALSIAISLCRSRCGNISCNPQWFLGGC